MTKIISLEQLYALRIQHYAQDVVVLATGVFDVLHAEHIKFLTAAKQAGNTLIVGLETDTRVRELKGPHRPINNLTTRLKNIANLNIADYVFSLENTMHTQVAREKFIRILHPNILAVSANTPHLDKKRQLMTLVGGKVQIVHPHNPQVSTSKILAQTKKQG